MHDTEGTAAKGSAHHVLIAYPERWNEEDRRPCFLGAPASHTVEAPFYPPQDLLQLDRDRYVQGELRHATAPERIFPLEVRFIGDFEKALEQKKGYLSPETLWACQRRGDVITCSQ